MAPRPKAPKVTTADAADMPAATLPTPVEPPQAPRPRDMAEAKRAIVEYHATGLSLTAAGNAIGVKRATITGWLETDELFREEIADAYLRDTENILDHLRKRLLVNDTLLMFETKKRRPEYRENYGAQINVGLNLGSLLPAIEAHIDADLARTRGTIEHKPYAALPAAATATADARQREGVEPMSNRPTTEPMPIDACDEPGLAEATTIERGKDHGSPAPHTERQQGFLGGKDHGSPAQPNIPIPRKANVSGEGEDAPIMPSAATKKLAGHPLMPDAQQSPIASPTALLDRVGDMLSASATAISDSHSQSASKRSNGVKRRADADKGG